MEVYRPFIGLVVTLTITWGFFGLGHYLKEKVEPKTERVNTPKWLRRLHGDFRKEGTLNFRDALIQASCYITLLIAILILWGFGLTAKTVGILLAIQFILLVIVNVVIFKVIPYLSRQ